MADVGRQDVMAGSEKHENNTEKVEERGEEDSEDDVYEVEKIVGMSSKEGKTVYRVRWQGYSPSWDTWEPYENLVSCRDMIDAYMEEHRKGRLNAKNIEFNSDVFSQEESSDHDSIVSKNSSTTSSRRKEKKQTYFYVPNSDDEADTLKDKFWRDLEQGKINVFGSDLYSKVKSQGRSARPSSFKVANMLPPDEVTDKGPKKKVRKQEAKSSRSVKMSRSDIKNRGRSQKHRSASDSGTSKTGAAKVKNRTGRKGKVLSAPLIDFQDEDLEVRENVSVDDHAEWLLSDENDTEGEVNLSNSNSQGYPYSLCLEEGSTVGVKEEPSSNDSPEAVQPQVSSEPNKSIITKEQNISSPKSQVTLPRLATDVKTNQSQADMVVYSEPPSSPVNCTASSAAYKDVAMTTTSPLPPDGISHSIKDICAKWLRKDPKLCSCVVVLEKVAWHKVASRLVTMHSPDCRSDIGSSQSIAISGQSQTKVHEKYTNKISKQECNLQNVHDQHESAVLVHETMSVQTTHSGNSKGIQPRGSGSDLNECKKENDIAKPIEAKSTDLDTKISRLALSSGVPSVTADVAAATDHKKHLSVCDISASAERLKRKSQDSELESPEVKVERTFGMEVDTNQNINNKDSNGQKRKYESDSEVLKKVKSDQSSGVLKVDGFVSSKNDSLTAQHKANSAASSNEQQLTSAGPQQAGQCEVTYQVTNYRALFTKQQGKNSGAQPATKGLQQVVAVQRQIQPDTPLASPLADNPYSEVESRQVASSNSASASPGSSVQSPVLMPSPHMGTYVTPRSGSVMSPLTPQTPLTPMTPGLGDETTFDFDLEELSQGLWDKRPQEKRLSESAELSNIDLKKAVWENNYELVRRALNCGRWFDLEQPDNTGLTLVMVAAQCGYDDVLELLVLNGANINARQKNGVTALMLACEQGHRCTVELLITMGAHMSPQESTGESALIKAVKCGNHFVVRILLDHGVSFASNINGAKECAAIRLSKQLQLPEITDLISAHISRVTSEFVSQVHITLNNTAKILCPLFPIHCFALAEGDKFTLTFNHELQPTRQGVGMLLFIAHARITSSEIKCRFYGPCAVNSATLNGAPLHPLTEEANFVLSFTPLRHGKNVVDIYTSGAPRSKAKLVVCAYKAQLSIPPD